MTQAVTISLYIVHSLSEIRCLSRDLECIVSECARARLSGLRQSVNVHISISVGRSVLRMTRWEAGLVPTPPSPTALSATGSIHHPPPRLTFVLRRVHLVQRESRRGVPTLNN